MNTVENLKLMHWLEQSNQPTIKEGSLYKVKFVDCSALTARLVILVSVFKIHF
jgi:hypothetical protein